MKISNSELISNFIDNENIFNSASNMSIERKKDYIVLYSYNSPIAVNFFNLNKIIVNNYRYSMTTKKQISNLSKQLGYKYLSVHDVRINIVDNIEILRNDIIIEQGVLERKRKPSTIATQQKYINRLIENLNGVICLNYELTKTVLRDDDFRLYLKYYNFLDIDYLKSYHSTHNYTQIHKIGQYYFTMGTMRGYTSISSLKRLIGGL